jgi:histidine triad (HIT) family protein
MATTSTDCLFCKLRDGIIPATITYQDDQVLAFADLKPQAPLHELVIPRKHLATLGEVTAEDAALLGRMMLVGAQRARDKGFGDKGFRVVMNSGRDAGQTVFHIHLHVLAGRPLSWPPG